MCLKARLWVALFVTIPGRFLSSLSPFSHLLPLLLCCECRQCRQVSNSSCSSVYKTIRSSSFPDSKIYLLGDHFRLSLAVRKFIPCYLDSSYIVSDSSDVRPSDLCCLENTLWFPLSALGEFPLAAHSLTLHLAKINLNLPIP